MSAARRSISCDVLIIGAGPAGLAFSLSLRGLGLDVRVVERQSESALSNPAYDGREIALSLRSMNILEQLGAINHIAADEIAPLCSAKVFNGRSDAALHFDARAVGENRLGSLLSNSTIRRALYTEHAARGEAHLITAAEMCGLTCGHDGGAARLKDGRSICARLIVAADSRFSAARRMAGIGSAIHDFAKTMIVNKAHLEHPHGHVAREHFIPGGALAILPLNGQEASIVQTFAPEEAERQMALDIETYLNRVSRRLGSRFGKLIPRSERFAYPLVGVYAHEFVRPGFALVGDAAVGMHPVTAHGFNLGVQGQALLAARIHEASKLGRRPSDPRVLSGYAREHRKLSIGKYWSTLAIAELYARENLPAKLVRRMLLDAGRLLLPARKAIMRNLTQPL